MPRLTDVILGDQSRQTFEVPDHYTAEEEAAVIKGMGARPDWLIPVRRKMIDVLSANPLDPSIETYGARAALDIVLPKSEEEIAAMLATGAFGGMLGAAGKAMTVPGSVTQKIAPTVLRSGLVGLVSGTVAYQRGVEDYKTRAAELAAGNLFGEALVGTGSVFVKNIGSRIPQRVSDAWATKFGEALDRTFPNQKTTGDIIRLFHAGEAKTLIKQRLDDFDNQIFTRLSPDATLQLPVLPELNQLVPKAQRVNVIKGPQGEDVGIVTFGDAFKSMRVLRDVRSDLISRGKGARAGQLLDYIKIYEEQLQRSVERAAPDAAALMRARLQQSSKMYAVKDVMENVPGLIESTDKGPIFHMEKLYDVFTWRTAPGGPSHLERLGQAGLDDFVEALYPRGTGPGWNIAQWEVGAPFVRGRVGQTSIGERVPVGTRITSYPGGPPGRQVPRTVGGIAGQRAIIAGEEAAREGGLIPGMGPVQ